MQANKQKKKAAHKKPLFKRFIIFMLFQFVFGCLSMPFLVFYGPFDTVKKSIVGATETTLSHQYISRFFLSDAAIKQLLRVGKAVDPYAKGKKIDVLSFNQKRSNKVEVFDIRGRLFEGKLILISDPTTVVAGYTSQMNKRGETTSTIARRAGAIAAINAGGFIDTKWSGTGGVPLGFIIHNGEVIYNSSKSETKKQDTAAITRDGMLIVGKHSISELKEYDVKEAVTFGPPLVVNGEPTIHGGDGGGGKAPRSALAQKADGTIIFLAIDGRRIDKPGATLWEVQDILLKNGAVNAVNLDGGSSTTMYYNGKVINNPCDALGERTIPTVFMVIPEGGGQAQ